MATAKKLPSGSWRVNQYIGKDEDGKRIYKSFTADTKKEAEYMAAEYLIEYEKEQEQACKLTLGEAIDLYIDSKIHILSPSTIVGYRGIRKNHLSTLMGQDINEITRQMIQKEISIESSKSSPKTVKNIHGLLSAVMHEYRPDFNFNTKLPQKEKPDIRIPTKEELRLILNACDDKEVYLAVILAAFEGLRRSEICALTWEDINLKKKTITISKAVVVDENKNIVQKNPKSYSGNRVLPIFDAARFVFNGANKKTGRIISLTPNQLSKKYGKVLRKLKIKGLRFHDLRHYFASVLLALNVPDKYAMELMGHSTNNMLKTVYQHTMQDKQNEVTESINNYFSDLMQHEMQHETKKAR